MTSGEFWTLVIVLIVLGLFYYIHAQVASDIDAVHEQIDSQMEYTLTLERRIVALEAFEKAAEGMLGDGGDEQEA